VSSASHAVYLLLLAGCLLGTLPLELVLGVRVYRRWRQLLLALVPTLVVFVAWDLYAIARGLWTYDPRYVVGVTLPGRLPLEELLFFVVVPVCGVLTFEAVSVSRPAWSGAT
jgi:lycopene cyclase domain-containing protein